ncbi:MAG: hypothetical protein J5486_04175 [Bacteroidaceae bacterium]|nr:hypothetical protein [Bacteroidaceae bacterium]
MTKKISARFSLIKAPADGNGIADVYSYFIACTLSQGVTRSNPSTGWVQGVFQQPTAEKPYAWKYTKTTYTKAGKEPAYSPCELICVWQTGINVNLLENAGFDSEEAMGEWSNRGSRLIPSITGFTKAAVATSGYITTSNSDKLPTFSFVTTSGTAGNAWPEIIPEGYYLWTNLTQYYVKDGSGATVTVQRQYCLSSSATTLSDATSWTSARQTPSASKPYVWMRDYVASATDTINIGHSDNVNLFLTYQRSSAYGGIDGIGKIVSGTQGHKALLSSIDLGSYNTAGKEIMSQALWSAGDNTRRALEENTWYTLSFWCKGYTVATSGNTEGAVDQGKHPSFNTYVYGGVKDGVDYQAINTGAGVYVDGVLNSWPGADGSARWEATATWVRHTFTFKTKSELSTLDKKLLFRMWPTSSASYRSYLYICMPKLEIGMQATGFIDNEQDYVGPPLRITRWEAGKQFYSGRKGEPYKDAVIFTDGKKYRCTETHISSSSNQPASGSTNQWWKIAYYLENVSTQLLLADDAYLVFTQTNRIFVHDANGNVAAGMGGAEGGINDFPIWVGKTYTERASASFRVSLAGKLFASNAEISGKIEASEGNFGDLVISGNDFVSKSGKLYFGKNGDASYDGSYLAIGTTPTYLQTNAHIHGVTYLAPYFAYFSAPNATALKLVGSTAIDSEGVVSMTTSRCSFQMQANNQTMGVTYGVHHTQIYMSSLGITLQSENASWRYMLLIESSGIKAQKYNKTTGTMSAETTLYS